MASASIARPAASGENTELLRYIKPLDGLRAIAALIVIVDHTYPNAGWVEFLHPGALAVKLFFVLSGFLITAILLQGRAQSEEAGGERRFLGAFYIRRSLRIFPIYYLALVVTAILSVKVNGLRGYLWWRFAYLTNFHMAIHFTQDSYYGHLWSLAVEEQFYLFWPWLILFLPTRWLGAAILAAVAVGPLSRGVSLLLGLNWLWWSGTPPWASFDALGMGALLAYSRWPGASPGASRICRTLCRWGLPLGIPMMLAGLWTNTVDGSMNTALLLGSGEAIAFAAMIDACVRPGTSWWCAALADDRLVYLGKISYGLYLYHAFVMPVSYAILHRCGLDYTGPTAAWFPHFYFGLTLALTVGIASLSWRFVEQPLNALKQRFPYRRPAPLPATAALA